MPSIILLSEDLINKIAAGEVIERPASVVKELLENALDAGATKITVDIEDYGQKLIRITDDGKGMDQEDAQNSILRHATSKIKDDKDLFAIRTLGFRGEALASIAAVSSFSLTTRPHQQQEGYYLHAEGGKILESGLAGTTPGTIVEVRDLFFNTPARKKFLKTDAVELRHILDVVMRYALINPLISFTLRHDRQELLYSPAVQDLRSNVATLYGIHLAKELLEVNYKDDLLSITGFIATPADARNDKNQQALYVNGRWVRNAEITNAIYEAYHSLLFLDKHPVVLLQLTIDPAKIDVNIHPTKLDVKFDQKEQVANAVCTAVKETLQKNNLIPTLSVDLERQVTFGTPAPKVEPATPAYMFEASTQAVFRPSYVAGESMGAASGAIVNDTPTDNNYKDYTPTNDIPPDTAPVIVPEYVQATELPGTTTLPPLRLLGQIHKTFFVAETEQGMFFLDQHAVHERVLYEKLMQQYLDTHIKIQSLLQGEIIEFSPTEKVAVLEHRQALARFGFMVEEFGANTFMLKTIPRVLDRQQPKEMIYELLALLQESKPERIQETIITRMACRAAVMAGEMVTIPEMESYLQELRHTVFPFTCPHGRPTMFKVTVDELERKFKRKN
ncbi:DNA mismatch repair endonuclease MutL [Candidatus Woesearchaeota archaeon]|nr:DNA mismatch repair endonuclease MutL [Candidatus Woesearchaeota archaeon]